MIELSGGSRRDRTADLMTASHALSQLSYGPLEDEEFSNDKEIDQTANISVCKILEIKGLM